MRSIVALWWLLAVAMLWNRASASQSYDAAVVEYFPYMQYSVEPLTKTEAQGVMAKNVEAYADFLTAAKRERPDLDIIVFPEVLGLFLFGATHSHRSWLCAGWSVWSRLPAAKR